MSQNYEYFGKYIFLEKLATGGMAEVWLARAPQAGGIAKFAAIKKILPQFSDNPEFIQMFKDEAKIAMNLSHSNIVSIYGYDKEQNQLYLVMDYVEGRNLRQILNKLKTSQTQKLSISQIVYIVKEVAAGLDHAHRCLDSATGKPLNITHRDMSPQNVMISYEGEVKIVDFGIAKAESQMENTKTGTLKGKFGYMSPEQAEGQLTDLRTDIFSLGIVLWELLANDRLFIANNEINTLRKIRECQVPSLIKINPSIHPELERITNKALTRDRNLRYQTSAAMHRDLSRFLNKFDPEFTPHDFAVFIKTLFTDEIMEARKKMVEYSKIPARNEMGRQDFADEKTNITSFPQSKENKKTASTSALPNFDQLTATKTDTMTDVSNPSVATDEDKTEVSKDDIKLSDTLSESIDSELPPKTTEKSRSKGSALNLDAMSNLNRSNIVVDTTGKSGSLEVEVVSPKKNRNNRDRDPVPAANKKRKPSSYEKREASSVSLVFVIALIIGGAFIGATFYPSEAVHIQNMVRNVLDLSSEAPAPTEKNPAPKIDAPEWLKDAEEKSPEPQVLNIPKTTIVIQSKPSGAEIFINGVNTNKQTPARVEVPAEQPFSIKLKRDRYIDYEQNNLMAIQISKKYEAVLQRALVSYVDIVVQPARSNVKLYVNNELLQDETIPVTRYAIPAKTDVKIRAELPVENLAAEQTVNLREDQRQTVILKLDKRGLAGEKQGKK